ncbi:hypothetical protein QBC46DRAFT_341409 [Diplogelasinospora grovesii]|uniref:Apple domain-containing protein n=1 Tax=Diplogelasinospora grovesii TaxID=303347 RepID=A0AAN6N7I2_9PEZI|nr:hypothetical protein QBC46DRAFT_341409 [Diplogelasinospora grovesii]
MTPPFATVSPSEHCPPPMGQPLRQQSLWGPAPGGHGHGAVPPQYPGTDGPVLGYPPPHPALPVPPADAGADFRRTVCGVRRGLFLLLLTLGGLTLMGIAIGVGVGVGINNQSRSSAAAAAAGTSSSTTPAATTTTTPTTTTLPPAANPAPSSTAPSPAATATSRSTCPGAANSQYQGSNGRMFLHLCGIDYSGKGQAQDIGSNVTTTFDECMESCANAKGCTGAGWGIMDGDGDEHTCWMKSSLNRSHTATPDWNFAVLLAT